MKFKVSHEYIAQAKDPETGVIKYQSAGPDEAKLVEWFKHHAHKGTFKGLDCDIKRRMILNGKPFYFHKKHLLWSVIAAQFLFIVWELSR